MAKIYVGNLPFTATEDQVRGLFTEHGAVNRLPSRWIARPTVRAASGSSR